MDKFVVRFFRRRRDERVILRNFILILISSLVSLTAADTICEDTVAGFGKQASMLIIFYAYQMMIDRATQDRYQTDNVLGSTGHDVASSST